MGIGDGKCTMTTEAMFENTLQVNPRPEIGGYFGMGSAVPCPMLQRNNLITTVIMISYQLAGWLTQTTTASSFPLFSKRWFWVDEK